MDNIIQTTSIYAGEDMQNIDKRHEFIENMRDELSKDEIVDMFKSALDKLDTKQTKNNTDSRTANSILFVGLISISDLVSDLICCYIYITSGDIFLQQLGYTSLGFLAFSVSFGTIMSWVFAAPCKYYISFIIFNQSLIFLFNSNRVGIIIINNWFRANC